MRIDIRLRNGTESTLEDNGDAESSLRTAAVILKGLGAICVQARNVERGLELFDPSDPDGCSVLVVGLRLKGGEETEPVSTAGAEN